MRCFLGINLNNHAKEFNNVKLPDAKSMKLAKQYHITRIFFKDLSEGEINSLLNKLDSFKFNSFNLSADRLGAFPNKSETELYGLCFSNESDLIKLKKKLSILIDNSSQDIFKPHITILRKEKLSKTFKKSKEIVRELKPISLKINEFGLYKSEPDIGMNSYTPIKIWKLK